MGAPVQREPWTKNNLSCELNFMGVEAMCFYKYSNGKEYKWDCSEKKDSCVNKKLVCTSGCYTALPNNAVKRITCESANSKQGAICTWNGEEKQCSAKKCKDGEFECPTDDCFQWRKLMAVYEHSPNLRP